MNSPESAGRYASTVAQRISTPGTMPPNGMGLGLGDRRGDVFTAGNTNKSCRGPQPPNLPAMRKVRERRLGVPAGAGQIRQHQPVGLDLVDPAAAYLEYFARLKVERLNLARDHFHPRHAPDPDRLHVAAVHEHRKREHEPELLVHDQEPPRPDPRDVFEYVAAHLRGAAARVDARHRQGVPPPPAGAPRGGAGGGPEPYHSFIAPFHREPTKARCLRASRSRWHVEQYFQREKTDLGLDHYEGRSWRGFHHHLVLSAVAHLFVTSCHLRAKKNFWPDVGTGLASNPSVVAEINRVLSQIGRAS